MDRLTPQQRSKNMSAIHSKDTKPEIVVRKGLWSRGFRYRLNDKRLPGHPDLVLRKYRTCIFINGCFWHKHDGCKYFVWPKNHAEFWKEKIEKNAVRDARNYDLLKKAGWHVIVIWECELKPQTRESTLSRLVGKL